MVFPILFVLHWAHTPIIGHCISRVFIPNLTDVHQKWKLMDTLVIHNLFHLRSQVVEKLSHILNFSHLFLDNEENTSPSPPTWLHI